MASNLHKLLSTLISLSIFLDSLPTAKTQECPYPCYPPPTGPGNVPPVSITPPASLSPPASFTPPVFTTPPAGYYPFTPPSPYYAGVTPPPPDPIVPWFPYYYRKPPHKDQSSSSPPISGSINVSIVFMFPLLLVSSFLFY